MKSSLCRLGSRVVVLAPVMVAGMVATVSAQMVPAQRPYRGLFGGNEADPNRRHSLDLQATLSGGYDGNAAADAHGGVGDPRFQRSSGFYGGALALGYTYHAGEATVSATASGTLRRYTKLDELVTEAYGAGVGVTAPLSRRTSVTAHQSISWSPYFQLGLLPPVFSPELGAVVGPNLDLVVSRWQAWSSYSTATLSHRFTQRSTLNLHYNRTSTDFEDTELPSVRQQFAGIAYGYGLTRNATLRLGYGYRRGDYGASQLARTPEGHTIDAGVDYSRALSFSRRTTLSFATGSTVLRTQDQSAPDARTDLFATGHVTLGHQMGRTWTASLSYARQVRFVYGFDEPILSDAVLAALGGYLGYRTNVAVQASWSSGQVSPRRELNTFGTYLASASIRHALSRFVALDANYFFYRYDFDRAAGLPSGLAPALDRQGVRVGLVVWLPLLR